MSYIIVLVWSIQYWIQEKKVLKFIKQLKVDKIAWILFLDNLLIVCFRKINSGLVNDSVVESN